MKQFDFKMSFWNYVDIGAVDNKTAVSDWKELGMNVPMTFDYDPDRHDKKVFLDQLDKCAEAGMKAIIRDARTHWGTLTQKGESEFKRGVKAAAADFGKHPGVFGFFIGDEPNGAQMGDVIKAHKIVKAAAPALTPFVNFFAWWGEPNFYDWLGVKGPWEYADLLDKVVKEAGIEIICADYYAQCSYEDNIYTDTYFLNLNIFQEVARRNGITLWTCPLTAGHWNFRCPTELDIMWQTSTAVAHGCMGLVWFYIYGRFWEGSFRNQPINILWEKTETFTWLSRQNRIFMKHFAPLMEGLKFDAVRHAGKCFGGTKPFVEGEFELSKIEWIVNPDVPLIVSRFIAPDGGVAYGIVNNSREKPARIRLHWKGKYAEKNAQVCHEWIGPGQLEILRL